MEETSSSSFPPLSAQKFSCLYFLPTLRTPSPIPKKMKKTRGTTLILRRASMRINNGRSFRFQEPTSPNVRCIGMVENNGKKKDQKTKKKKRRENDRVGKEQTHAAAVSPPNSSLLNLFRLFKKKGTISANPYVESSSSAAAAAASTKSVPKLGQAKKLFIGFGWRVHDSSAVAPDSLSSLPNKREKRNDAVVAENIELVPRKEINLWKKRMVAPPPLLLV